MNTLGLTSVQTCIMAAFGQYKNLLTGTIEVPTAQGIVRVTSGINGTLFNTGFPGYNINSNDLTALRAWCTANPGNGWSFGYRGQNTTHPDSVNITLIDFNQYMFNFHVYLA